MKRSAVVGGVALVMISGALFWRCAPFSSQLSSMAGWALAIVFSIGLILFIQSGFIRLLNNVRSERKIATDMQKSQLSRLAGPAAGLICLLVLGSALCLFARLTDGRLGWGSEGQAWGTFLAGFTVHLIACLLGTMARFREIEILSPPA